MNEKIYDEKIAPLMTQIIEICKEHKLPMFATFQYDKYDFCTTVHRGKDYKSHPLFNHLTILRDCAEEDGINIDKYLSWIIRSLGDKKHSSIYLHIINEYMNQDVLEE